MSTTTPSRRKGPCADDPHVALWFAYFQGGFSTARRRTRDGDPYGADLALTRAQVRWEAAHLLRQAESTVQAAAAMLTEAKQHTVHFWPLVGPDPFDTGREYTRARTWQDCARHLHPNLPEVQPLHWRGE